MEMTKNCLWCARIFTSRVARKKYCQGQCKRHAKRSRANGLGGVRRSTHYKNMPHSDRKKAYERNKRLKEAGYTLTTFAAAKEAQEGRCAACGEIPEPNAGWSEGLVPDHKHNTIPPQPRGLLCAHCNSLIGFALDRPEVCEAAAAYLRKWC